MGIGGAIGCHDMNCQIVLRFFYHIAFCMLAISRRTPVVIQLTLSVLASSLTALVTGGVEAEAPILLHEPPQLYRLVFHAFSQ